MDEELSRQTRKFSRAAPLLALSPPQAGTRMGPLQNLIRREKTAQTACCGCEYRFLITERRGFSIISYQLLLDLHILRQGIRQTAFPRTVSIYHISRQMERNFLIRYLTAAGPKLHLLSFWRFYKNLEKQLSAYCIYFLDQLCNTSIIVADFWLFLVKAPYTRELPIKNCLVSAQKTSSIYTNQTNKKSTIYKQQDNKRLAFLWKPVI